MTNAKCWKCNGTGRVLGSGVYNYEPCPLCRPIAREQWEAEQEAIKTKQKELK
jgi:hypothetical protein